MSNENKRTKNIGLILGIVVGILTIVGFIVGGYFVLLGRIETVVTKKLRDPEVIKQIATLVRPSMVFDHKGSIISDSGAKQFIENISVEMRQEEPTKIIITPRQHLNSPPILEGLNYSFGMKVKRGNKSDWIYELSSPAYLVMDESQTIREWIFRLEIVR